MKLKKLLVLCLSLCMALALCACKDDNAEGTTSPSVPGTTDSALSTSPAADDGQQGGGTVDFGLQTAPDPNFDSPATGTDSGKLYTIVGDYAYELDPSTLEPIGDPLDPITHQPVSNPVLDGTNPSTPNNPQNSQPPASQPPASQPPASQPPASQPPAPENTPDTSLPNTGIFLEDD